MRHLDEGEIHAWLDGAVDADQAAGIESHAAVCAECAAAVATARGLIAGASRILLSLDDVPGGVIPAQRPTTADAGRTAPGELAPTISDIGFARHTKAAQRRQSVWFTRPWVRIAAGLVLVAGIGVVATRDDPNGARDQVTIDFRTEPAPTVSTAASAPPAVPLVVTGAAPVAEAGAASAVRALDRTGGVTAGAAAAIPAAGRAMAPPPAIASAAAPTVVAQGAARADAIGGERARSLSEVSVASERDRTVVAKAAVSADSTPPRRIGDSGLRLSNVVVTGVGEQSVAAAGRVADAGRIAAPAPPVPFTVGPALPTHLGGACFALDVIPGSDTLGIPLIPRMMRIRLADFPTVDEAGVRLRRSETANLQGAASGAAVGAVQGRQAAPAGANAFARAPITEPAEALSWTHFSADTVVVQWSTATDVVVFRLGVVGDLVRGTAAGQASVAPPARVTGRKVACGG